MKVSRRQFVSLVLFMFTLGGCSEFNGIRKPLYDSQLIEPDEEAINTYQETREITDEEKNYYFRYPFSEAIYEQSLPYPDEEPVLLTEGEYRIGEDLPAGRVTLIGNESVFTSENNEVHVGNFIIRDEANDVYFENLFHTDYGQSVAQVDLINDYSIEIIGSDPEITVFYSDTLPKDPYILMDPPKVLVNLERLETPQAIELDEENHTVSLSAGIYEVGEHLEPGTYELTDVQSVHSTELYLFREGEEPRVFELLVNNSSEDEELTLQEQIAEGYPQIELQTGDKIYPNLVSVLQLKKI